MASRRWFHPNLSGPEAETLLKVQGTDGSFIARPSKRQPGDFTISVRLGEKVHHLRIQNTGDYYDLYGGDKFATLAELVEHYSKNWGVVKSGGDTQVYLKYPLLCADPTKQRWFHGQIKGKAAEKMLLEKGKEGSFLVRGSRSNPGDFVLSVRNGEKIHHIMIVCKDEKYILAGNEDCSESFASLTDLVEHYKKAGLNEKNGDDIRLVMPFNATHITASGISDRIQELEKEGAPKGDAKPKKGFMEEFEMLTQQDDTKLERNAGKKDECRHKNRYKNILPFDFNRVILKDGDPKVLGTDYINANLIKNTDLPVSTRQYIATQGCLKTTVTDFWRMIWQHNSRIIVMTTKLVELGKNKCVQYWPVLRGKPHEMTLYTGTLRVSNVSERTAQDHVVREFDVSFQSNDPNVVPQPPRKVYHFHLTGWPDHGVPADPGVVLSFLQKIDDIQESIPEAGPVVVHCSAGIGRTGTVLIVDMILQQIKLLGSDCEIDVQKMTLMVRAQRSGMVQTETQYRFIYMAVRHYIDQQAKQKQQVKPGQSSRRAPPKLPEEPQLYENIGAMKMG